MIAVEIKGVDELNKRLDSLKVETRYKTGRSALRRASMIVVKAAQMKAQQHDDKETGRKISDNIATRWNGRLYKSTGDLGFRVGVMQGAILPKKGERTDKGAKGPTPHWRLLEFGTEKMPEYPFMRPALENNIDRVTNEFVRAYNLGIDRALKKGGS